MENNQQRISCSDPMADCVLPQDMILCIATRLPVRSICRFKAVCKPLCRLFNHPKFMKMHHAQLSQSQSVIVFAPTFWSNLSLFDTNEEKEKPTNLADPFPEVLAAMSFIGCCNGLICVSFMPNLHIIELWNPALKLNKSPSWPSLALFDATAKVSLGFGYDDEGDDFKLVRIVVSVGKTKKLSLGVEVYSCNSDSWEIIKVGFKFIVRWPKNDAIVNGNPYWVALVGGNEVLVWFDTSKMVFNTVPLSTLEIKEVADVPLVNWKGSLAALACAKSDSKVLSLDVWVFDAVAKVWSKNFTFGPIELKVERVLQCFQNGKIIGECIEEAKLFVFDSENGGVKEIVIDGAKKRFFQVCGYTESMAYFKGLAKERVRTEEEELEIDKDVAGFFKRRLGVNLAVPFKFRKPGTSS